MGKRSVSVCILHSEDTFPLDESPLCSLSGLFGSKWICRRDLRARRWSRQRVSHPMKPAKQRVTSARFPGMVQQRCPRWFSEGRASLRDAGQDLASRLEPVYSQVEQPSLAPTQASPPAACPRRQRPDLHTLERDAAYALIYS